MKYKLLDNTYIVADSHLNDDKQQFNKFLDNFVNKDYDCSCLILLGDIFDFLSEESTYFINKYKNTIEKINNISNKIPIYYFEGNHDYNLKSLFPNINVISRDKQPALFFSDSENIKISHGDIQCGLIYEVYTKIIRNSYLLKFLNFLDVNNFISKKIDKKLQKKSICNKYDNFEEKIKHKYINNDIDIIIEGHYHQGKSFNIKNNVKYVNIPSLYCDNKFIVYKNNKFEKRYI